MSIILMPIKPEYVEEIMSGRKKYEYRKIKAKSINIDKMIIYATSPIMKIVGEVEITGILEETPDNLWEKTFEHSGIIKQKYDEYYNGKNNAIAYKIGKIEKYKNPINLNEIGIKYCPQSFVYIDR